MAILIAEDNLVLSKAISRALALLGHETEIVHSLAELRRALSLRTHSGYCLDLHFSDGNVLDTVEINKIKWQTQSKLVVMTGAESEEDRKRAARMGIERLLVKPFPLAELKNIFPGNAQEAHSK
jgi:DNA-binding response OmpR family regulator